MGKYGAIGGGVSYGIAVDLPDAVQNAFTENPRFHLFLNFALKAFDVAYAGYKVGNAMVGADGWDTALSAVGDLADPTPRVFKGVVKGGSRLLGIGRKATKSEKLLLGRSSSVKARVNAGQGQASVVREGASAKEIFKKNFSDIRKVKQIEFDSKGVPNSMADILKEPNRGGQFSRAERFMIKQRSDLRKKTTFINE